MPTSFSSVGISMPTAKIGSNHKTGNQQHQPYSYHEEEPVGGSF
ncbi:MULTISPECIES: hypothetical protein [Rufibacter]|nr:hypothetical protein [Rufibacter ruber]